MRIKNLAERSRIQLRQEPEPIRVSESVKVSLVKQYGKPSRIRIEAPKQVLALVDAYVDPFKPFKGFGELPLTPLSVDRVCEKFGVDVELDANVRNWLSNEVYIRRLMNDELNLPDQTRSGKLVNDLYHFQQQGVGFMAYTEMIPANREGLRILQCDDPRLGKTIQTCISVLAPENTPALVVCLKSLKTYWAQQIEKWTQGLKVVILEGSIYDRLQQIEECVEKPNIVMITNWETLRKIDKVPNKILKKIVTVVGDEAHIVRNSKTQVAKGLLKLKPKNAVLLTATPLERGPQDYFTYLKFLRPWEFSSYWRFIGWFCETENNGFGNSVVGVRNVDLLKDLMYPLMLRRQAADVANVPSKIFETISIPTTPEFDEVYDAVRHNALKELDGFDIDDVELFLPNALAILTRLRQMSVDPSLLGFDIESPKLDPLLEIVETRYMNEKIVVFCSFNDTLDTLNFHLGDKIGIRFTGLQEEIDLFNDDPEKRIFLTTPQKGGAGVDLSAASVIIYYDLPFSSTLLRQSMDRTTKIGIEQSRMIISLSATPTDETIAELLSTKLENISDVDIITRALIAEKGAQK